MTDTENSGRVQSPLVRGEWIEISRESIAIPYAHPSPLVRGEWIEMESGKNNKMWGEVSPRERGVD